MKRVIVLFTALVITMAANAQNLSAPQPSPTQTIKQNFATGSIELSYSRPAKKGRKVMGNLVPYGKVWRTGANAPTTITFSEDVSIGGKELKAGKYGLLSIPDAAKWTIIISKDVTVNQPASYKPENDAARIEADVMTLPYSIENFTIGIADITGSSCNIQLMWENAYVQFAVTTNTDSRVMKQIDDVMNKDNKPYFAAASYYYDNGKDLNQALGWVNKAVETNKEAFWMYLLKARIQKKWAIKQRLKLQLLPAKTLLQPQKMMTT
jgi:hypothetical protein